MINEKCQHKNERGNFCSQCGEKLKELCKCGAMKPIGAEFCLTKEEVEWKLWENRREINADWRLGVSMIVPLFTIMVLVVISVTYYSEKNQVSGSVFLVWFSIVALVYLASIWVGLKWQGSADKKVDEEFLRKNPHYAEILKKAEEEK